MSQHLQPLTVSMFWLDEPQHMLSLSEHKHTYQNKESGATGPVCASVFVYTKSRGEMFLADAQSGIRRLSLPRTSLTLFCLFFAAVTSCQTLQSSSYASARVRAVRGGRGHTDLKLQAVGGALKEKSGSSRLENDLSGVWKKVRQLPFFSVTSWRGMYSNTSTAVYTGSWQTE